ncbi:NUDIX hydrolase [bacterium]|nr:NUDIX hydrolase [bacterium]
MNNIGVFVFLVYEQKLLMVRRNYGDFSWVLPGGSVEEGETLRDTLVREIQEETGILITSEPKFHSTYYYPVEYSLAFCYYIPLDTIPENFSFNEKELAEVKLFQNAELPFSNMSIFTKKKVDIFIGNAIDACKDFVYEYE